MKKYTEMVHWVSPGESLHRIARHYLPLTDELTVKDLIDKIKRLSGIRGSLIRPKQQLLIPLVRQTRVVAKTVPKQADFEAKGIYVNRYSMACEKIKRLVDSIVASGGNTVILDGKDMSGRVSYASNVKSVQEIGASSNPTVGDLAKLIHYLHQKGVHVGVRLVLFYDPLLAARRPKLALRYPTNDDARVDSGLWVDPVQPAVQNHNLDIAKELAGMGVDEIQFDYIRFPTTEIIHGAESKLHELMIPRHRIITDFLARARKELAPYNVLLSIDVFGIVAWGRSEDIEITGQKIEDLAQHCDVMCPMIYPSHFYGPFQGMASPGDHPYLLVEETCRKFSTFLRDSKVTLRPWIQAFPFGTNNFDEGYILEQLRALNRWNAKGWLLWSAGNAYDTAWGALVQWNETILKGKTVRTRLHLDDEATRGSPLEKT